jgi:hypothetical protein
MNKIIFIGIIIIIIIIILYFFLNTKKEYFQETKISEDDLIYLNDKKDKKQTEFDNAIIQLSISASPNKEIDKLFSAFGVIYIVKNIISNDPDLFNSTEKLLNLLNMILGIDKNSPIFNKPLVKDNIIKEINIIFKDKKDMIYDIYDKYYLIILDESKSNLDESKSNLDESKSNLDESKSKLIIEQYDLDPTPTTTSLAPLNSAFKMPLIQLYNPN